MIDLVASAIVFSGFFYLQHLLLEFFELSFILFQTCLLKDYIVMRVLKCFKKKLLNLI